MDIKSINSSDLISICLFNEIIIFANKLIAINTYRNSFIINKLCEISKTEELFKNPSHDYTKELLTLMPKIESIYN